MTNAQKQLEERIDAFAHDIASIITATVEEAVTNALSNGGNGTTKKRAPSKKSANGRAPGEKRSPSELRAVVEKLYNEIAREGDRRIEQIGEAMGMPTSELALPIKKLLAAKRIKKKGDRRATRYTALPKKK